MVSEENRLSWEMYRFTGFELAPAYIDLRQVAAITAARNPAGELVDGARVILYCGAAIFVRESAEAVFEEVHRVRTGAPPKVPSMKYGASAPAALDAPPVAGERPE